MSIDKNSRAQSGIHRRILRRTRHRSRSTSVVVTLTTLIAVLAWVATECVLAALDRGPLLLSPASVLAATENPDDVTLAIAGGLAVIGLVLVTLAIGPARRARHELPDERMAVVIDDGVLAGAMVRAAVRESRLPDSRVSAVVSRRRGTVSVVPTSGNLLNSAAIARAVGQAVDSLSPSPAVRTHVSVSTRGVVGS